MRVFPYLLSALLAALSGCGQTGVCPDCRGDTELDLTVVDEVTGEPIPGVAFSIAGHPLALECRDWTVDAGACRDWGTSDPPTGAQTVTVSAPGHASADFSYQLDPGPPPGQCGCGEATGGTVKLTPQ